MKVIGTLGTVLNSLIRFANSEAAADPTVEKNEKNVEICTQNLRAIDKAIHAYQKEHGDFPEWLSDLHPKHLADANILICPADDEGGKTIFSENTDPKMPVSYGYQFHPEYRAEKSEQREMYGDVIPLVRCRHHANEEFHCLNLSFSSKIYKSSAVWESTPEDLYGSHEAAITALEDALARHPDDRRFFNLYEPLVRLYIKTENEQAAITALEDALARHPNDKRFSNLYKQLVHLYIKTGNEQAADAVIKRFQSVMEPDLPGYRMLFGMLDEIGRYEDMLEAFKEAERQHPDAEPILWRLAYIYRKLGNIELADVYDRKADPTYELIGKPVPEFSVTDLNGNPISLQDYRGKIVLIDFWEIWCGFCTLEMPNIKKVYDTYKDEGFDVIGISLDTKASELQDYIKENDIQWRQIYTGGKRDDPLLQQYNITGVPTQWLLDRDGKLITHKARGDALEQLVADALKE